MGSCQRNGAARAVALLVALALVGGCRTTRVAPISSAAGAFEPARDERRLWERSREEEKKLRDNVTLYPDPLLVDYLEDVVNRLNPPGMAANPEISYRVTVVEDPTLNAFAYPTGSLYVHTGLLARMENESQLATVLGHEMSHVEGRHMLRNQRSARNKQIGFGVASIAAAVILAGEEGDAWRAGHYGKAVRISVLGQVLVGLGLQLAFLAAVNGYGRDLEREADEGAFEKLTAAGYDPREAPAVYEALLADHGDAGQAEAFFFGSHPQLAARIDNARAWVAAHPDVAPTPGIADPEAFARRMRPVLRDDARMNIDAGRLELAAFELERARRAFADDPETAFLFARLHLARADNEKEPDAQRDERRRAESELREAIRLDPERPAPHRELGLLAYRDEEYATACVSFRHYVELAPTADDAARIRDYVTELERDGRCP